MFPDTKRIDGKFNFSFCQIRAFILRDFSVCVIKRDIISKFQTILERMYSPVIQLPP